MSAENGYSKYKLIKHFAALGPYIREEKCTDRFFFFDCLAECVNIKPTPEKREFWGWWLELEKQQNGFSYNYSLGLYDKAGNWQEIPIKSENMNGKLMSALRVFHERLTALMQQLQLPLVPAEETEIVS